MKTLKTEKAAKTLILGIGNVLMGDEGVGVSVVRELEKTALLPENVEILDGGVGSFLLLEPMQSAEKLILIDATIDGAAAGTVRRLRPRYSKDYPRTLTAHDIGLKDLLDTFYLLGRAAARRYAFRSFDSAACAYDDGAFAGIIARCTAGRADGFRGNHSQLKRICMNFQSL
jgi:hydrogenase maturation protease